MFLCWCQYKDSEKQEASWPDKHPGQRHQLMSSASAKDWEYHQRKSRLVLLLCVGFRYYTAPAWTHKAVVSGGDSGISARRLPLE